MTLSSFSMGSVATYPCDHVGNGYLGLDTGWTPSSTGSRRPIRRLRAEAGAGRWSLDRVWPRWRCPTKSGNTPRPSGRPPATRRSAPRWPPSRNPKTRPRPRTVAQPADNPNGDAPVSYSASATLRGPADLQTTSRRRSVALTIISATPGDPASHAPAPVVTGHRSRVGRSGAPGAPPPSRRS